ncbi:MAG: amino acid aminotransferase [Sphingomonas sp.]
MSAPRTSTFPVFSTLMPQAPDALLMLIGMHRRDTRSTKLDLGVGVYRDALGATPVMRAMRAAEARLLETQTTKAYLGAEGDPRYTELLASVALGSAAASSPRLTGVQTPGGTGALRLGAELIGRARRNAQIWIGAPTWPNHAPIFREAGLIVRVHPYYDVASGTIDFGAIMTALEEAVPGDIVLLHGCCHNPTGADFDTDQWCTLAAFMAQRGLIPFIDLAYQGLGDGLDGDAAGARMLFEAVPEALLAYSCDKNFALYRERVGALWVRSEHASTLPQVRDNILVLARSLWSMPPDHGAAAVRIILEDAALRSDWLEELGGMRGRINDLRAAIVAAEPRLAFIARQRGLFAMLPIDKQAVVALREEHGIYMAESGRINVAGLTLSTIAPFVAALAPYLS